LNALSLLKKAVIIFIIAITGWGLCGSIIGIGRNVTTMQNTLIMHAIGAPVIFAVLSWIYFRFFHFTSPLQTAVIFLALTVSMDFFVIAIFIEKSFAMFGSILGVWIPFALIFASTCLVGLFVSKRSVHKVSQLAVS